MILTGEKRALRDLLIVKFVPENSYGVTIRKTENIILLKQR